MMRNGVTRSIALALCLSLPVPVMAGSLGKLVNEGNSAFEKSEEANKQWLKKEQEADRRRDALARERARQRAEEARRNPTYYAPSPSESGSGSSSSSSSGGSKSASSSGSTRGVRSIRDNGRINGDPSWVITCTSSSRVVRRRGNTWTDDTGHTFSDRLWSLPLEDFARKLCE